MAERSRQQTLVVVVSAKSRLRNVDLSTLRRVFARQPSGLELIPLNHPVGRSARGLFDRLVLGLREREVGRYWINRKVRGETGPPPTVASPRKLAKIVARHPRAITYLALPGLLPGLRVLAIDGKLPGHPDYPLRGAP